MLIDVVGARARSNVITQALENAPPALRAAV